MTELARTKLGDWGLTVANEVREILIAAQHVADGYHVGDDPDYIEVPARLAEYVDGAIGLMKLPLVLVPADGLQNGYYVGPERHFRI